MALVRCTASVTPARPDEHFIADADNVGIYQGYVRSHITLCPHRPSIHKAPQRQAGQIRLSDFRLCYLDNANPLLSFQLHLAQILQSDYYAGLFTSSPKVTLHLTPAPQQSDWLCHVCAFNNPYVLNVCSLCGVPQPLQSPSTPCPACTFLNPPDRSTCEICESPLDDVLIIKLSFRKGGDKPFYAALKRALQAKAWLTAPSTTSTTTGTGISGILHTAQASAQGQQDHLKDALQDLEALMAKAKDMVSLAADLNEKLSATRASEPEEATFIRSSLSQLGLQMPNAPVTIAVSSLSMKSGEVGIALEAWLSSLPRLFSKSSLFCRYIQRLRSICALLTRG